MTTFAAGINSKIGYIKEVSPGVTPATPAYSLLPFTTFNLTGTRDSFSDPSIISDRQNHFFAYGNIHTAGDMDSIALAQIATTGNMLQDPFWESVMRASWTANVLKIGITPTTFTFESINQDVGLAQPIYSRYTGVEVSQVALTVNMNSVSTAKWSLMGLGYNMSTTGIAGTTYLPIPSTSQPLIHGNVGSIFKEGGSSSAIMTSITLNVANTMDANFALGDYTAKNLTAGKIKITGTITAYFQDLTLLNKFLNGTSTSVEFKISDGTRALNFNMPRVFYSGAAKTVPNDKALTLTLPFEAIYDETNSSSLIITRS